MCVRLTRVITLDHRKRGRWRAGRQMLKICPSFCHYPATQHVTSIEHHYPSSLRGYFRKCKASTASLFLGCVIRHRLTQPITEIKAWDRGQCSPLSAEVQLSCWITIEPFLELISGTVAGARCGERVSASICQQ